MATINSTAEVAAAARPDLVLVSANFGQVITGTDGSDNLSGGDSIFVHYGNDTVNAGGGNDHIFDQGSGDDLLRGEAGSDWITVGPGNDTVDGGPGTDIVDYSDSQQIVGLDPASGFAIPEGIDTLVSIENAIGGVGSDALLGDDGPNDLSGGLAFETGNDRIEGRGGNGRLSGEGGNGTLLHGGGGDTLIGDGGFGYDVLGGGAGSDVLIGGPGIDEMTGGPGADRFVFESFADFGSSGLDTIHDFQHGADVIDLRGLDARPDQPGDQVFTFDGTPDGGWEEFLDGLSDDWQGLVTSRGGPTINGDPGEIEFRHEGGFTYVFLATGDGPTEASFRLDGTVTLTAADFLL